MKSLFGGSAVIAATILSSSFLLSARPSVAETLLSSFQKPQAESSQVSKQQPQPETPAAGLSAIAPADSAKTIVETAPNTTAATAAGESAAAKSASESPVPLSPASSSVTATAATESIVRPAGPATTYTATAYSLGGRTASGARVSKGLIAADPRVLPLGTRVRIDAGAYSGEYVVADTGGAVRGKKIDIWTPNSREANRFGKRQVKLTVLSYPVKRDRAATRRRKR